jgi:hypothetical protein
MTGLNDPGDAGYENTDKEVIQKDLIRYQTMTRTQVAEDLRRQAEQALPSLVEICKALAGSLGMEEVGIGPIKEVHAALKKAEKKYEGDLLKVTDYCRALLVVKDLPSLLALLELARDSFGPLIRRVKLSSLKSDHKALQGGGYRHCIINVELKEHICEIQVHLWPMWLVCGVDGFRHYRHCVEYNTDSFENAYDALEGLDRKTMAELIVMAEEAVAETPLDSLEWFQEKFILDYFAEVGLFLKHGLYVWAEITLRHLVRLRTESPDIGPQHHETILLYQYLEEVLTMTGRKKEAKEIRARLRDNGKQSFRVAIEAPGLESFPSGRRRVQFFHCTDSLVLLLSGRLGRTTTQIGEGRGRKIDVGCGHVRSGGGSGHDHGPEQEGARGGRKATGGSEGVQEAVEDDPEGAIFVPGRERNVRHG